MRRILVVEDDSHVRAIGAWLGQHGFRVCIADGDISGLAALERSTFDLMTAEVSVPELRCFAAIELFHPRAPGVSLIAISGCAFPNPDTGAPDFMKIAAGLGATRCLRKPCKPSAPCLDVINQCLSEAEPHRRHVATLGAIAKSADDTMGDACRI
jgi:DNA-binding NtrC family response regulator